MPLPSELEETCNSLTKIIDKIESFYNEDGSIKNTGLENLMETIDNDLKKSAIQSLSNAQVQATSMYTLNTLMWILMKINNLDPKTYIKDNMRENLDQQGTLMNEIKIVQSIITKVNEGEALVKTMRVDKSAVKRILKHNLPRPEGEEASES